MPDETMEPRYFPGELLYVDPAIPAKAGDFVVVQSGDASAIIARYKQRTAESVIIETLNPPSEKAFSLRSAELHCIVGMLSIRS